MSECDIASRCQALVEFEAVALLRAWLLLGVQQTGMLAWLNPLYEINKNPIENAGQAKTSWETLPDCADSERIGLGTGRNKLRPYRRIPRLFIL
jgi:hypothetical protein